MCKAPVFFSIAVVAAMAAGSTLSARGSESSEIQECSDADIASHALSPTSASSDEAAAVDEEHEKTSWPPVDYKDQLIAAWKTGIQKAKAAPLVILSKSERPDRDDDRRDTMTGKILSRLEEDFGIADIPLLVDVPCAPNGRTYSWAVNAAIKVAKKALEAMGDDFVGLYPKTVTAGEVPRRLLGSLPGVPHLHYPSEWLRADKGQHETAYATLSERIDGFYSKEKFREVIRDAFSTEVRRASSAINGRSEACRAAVSVTGSIAGHLHLESDARAKQSASATKYMATAKGKAMAKKAAENMLKKRDAEKTKENAARASQEYREKYTTLDWETINRFLEQKHHDIDGIAYETMDTREHILERARDRVRRAAAPERAKEAQATLDILKRVTPVYRNKTVPPPPTPRVIACVNAWKPLGLTAQDIALISPESTSAHAVAFHGGLCGMHEIRTQKRTGPAGASPSDRADWFSVEQLRSMLIDGSSEERCRRVASMLAGNKRYTVAIWTQFLRKLWSNEVSVAENPEAVVSKITKRRRAKDAAVDRDEAARVHNAPLRQKLQARSDALSQTKRQRRGDAAGGDDSEPASTPGASSSGHN